MIDENDKGAELIAATEAHIDAMPNVPKFHFLRLLDLDSLSDDDLAVMKKGLDLIAAIDRLRAVAGKDIHFDIPARPTVRPDNAGCPDAVEGGT
jgi:hypothetical protein